MNRSGRLAPGLLALGAVALVVVGAFAGLLVESAGNPSAALGAFDPYLLGVVRFTLWQAVLSTVVSVVPGLFIARALANTPRLPGRRLILALFAVPLALPAIVMALGVLALLGRAGILAEFLTALRGERWPGIYGLGGILVAHAFFNVPLATRLFLQALDTVPNDQWRLAAQLGMRAPSTFRLVEWPVLRRALPGVAGLVFMLCLTSFAIVLILGGGPRATTLEVAIYQALRFDFAPSRAVVLVAIQLVMTALLIGILTRSGANTMPDPALSLVTRRPSRKPGLSSTIDVGLIALAAVFVLAPMAATVAAGLSADLARLIGDEAFHRASVTSLVLASMAAAMAVLIASALVSARYYLEGLRRKSWMARLLERLMDTGAGFVLVVPPIVLGAGWFILLRRTGDVLSYAPAMVVAVNAVMALPFVLRVLRPAHDAAAARHDRLVASLGMGRFDRLRLVDWPVLRAPLATAFAFAMALSLGDLGVIALFGSDAVQTLPYLLMSRMGSYRTEDAAGIALLLALLCLLLMMIAEWSGRRRA